MASVKRSKVAAPVQQSVLSHRIHALLNMVRVIGHAEDELCTLLHEAEHGEAAGQALSRDLRALIARLPAVEYVHDLEALEAMIGSSGKRVATRASGVRAMRPSARKVAGKKTVARKPGATRVTGAKVAAAGRRTQS